jgi:hypothetical protein
MIDPMIVKAVSVALGFLLIGSAWHKLSSLPVFAAVVEDYQLAPAFLAPSIARTLPALEIILGLAWITGLAMPLVAPLTAAMFAVYALAIAINLWRGRVHISCGCGLGGASTENQPLSWVLVFRNMLLISASLLPLGAVSERTLGLLDWLMLTAALLASGLLYLGASQLLQNQANIRSWRNPHD